MGSRVSIKDIAKEAGVASSTVSRVLNNVQLAYPVAEKTRQKIFSAVKRLNYTPNINAKRLSQSKSYAVGLVIPSLDNLKDRYSVFEDFSFMEAMQGIEKAMYNSQYRLTLIFRNKRYIEQKEYLKLFNEKLVDGLVIWGSMLSDDYLTELKGKPMVQMNSYAQKTSSGVRAEIDHFQGGFIVGETLIKAGKRNILYISGKEDVAITHTHRNGFVESLKSHGIEPNKKLFFPGNFNPECVNEILESAISNQQQFDAICCINDNLARQSRIFLDESYPEIAKNMIYGGGGMAANPLEHKKYIGIHSYLCNYAEMGRLGTEALLSWVDTDKKPDSKIISTEPIFINNI